MNYSTLVKIITLSVMISCNSVFGANTLIPARDVLTPTNTSLPVKTPVTISTSFTRYVNTCKKELGFDIIPQMDCRDINFRPRTHEPNFTRSNDWVSHAQLNSSVDVLFACRWVENNTGVSGTATGEMLVHNRDNGKTCFFKLKTRLVEIDPRAHGDTGFLIFRKELSGTLFFQASTTNPASPTAFDAEKFWEQPEKIVDRDRDICTRCHSAGPYIASPEIVGALAKYGLINDRHDVQGNMYTAVGSAVEKRLNSFIKLTIQDPDSPIANCSSKCHLTGGNSITLDTTFSPRDGTNEIIMPSINGILDNIVANGHMPPNDPFSDYRWINRDTPDNTAAGDYERLAAVKTEFNEIYETCKNPEYMQAYEVDNTLMMATNEFVDVINTFNLHDGLICLNADQDDGRCTSYEIRYRCNGKWTSWQSNEGVSGTGDNETRDRFKFPSWCKTPYAIQARYYTGDDVHVVNGPPDRLYQFDKNGLVCRNKDQPDGQSCHNYTVRFICP